VKIVDMRITPCRIPVKAPLRFSWGAHPAIQRIIVELETDDGLVGLGEAYGEPHRLLALEQARPFVVGQSPYNLEELRWRIMPPGQVKLFLGPVAYHAYAAVEFACLDLIGQRTGRPVYDLIGGKLRDEVPLSAYLFYRYANEDGEGEVRTPDEVVALATRFIDTYGFGAIKFKCGVLPPDEEVAAFRALRTAFPSLRIRLDPNGVWAIGTAVSVAHALRDERVEYLEDPTWSIRGLARVAEQAPWMTLASNQAVFSFEDLLPNLLTSGVDIILMDPHWYGGLRACKQLGRMAEAYGFDLGMHSGSEFGISQAAQLHAAAAVPNVAEAYALDTHYPHLVDDVIEGGLLPIVDGQMRVPTDPGLGVKLDREKLETYHELYQRDGFSSWTQDPFDPQTMPVIPKW
jgi:glucarate dehydratase